MWTQRDQLEAYQFLRRRIVSALQFGDANHPVSPARRVLLGSAVGFGCALLLTAGVGIAAVLHPGGGDWRRPGRVIIEKETGASYVVTADGTLHPVVNYASARLLAGPGSGTALVPAGRLASARRGRPLGIAGAPASLPVRAALLGGAWSVCSSTPARAVTVVVGSPAPGGTLNPAQGLYVETGAGNRYVVTGGVRLRLRGTAEAVALGYDTRTPVPVADALVESLPAGPDLALIRVTDSGSPGPRVGETATLVGQILMVTNVGGADRYYLVARQNLVPVTQTEAALILGNRANRPAYPNGVPRAVAVPAADVAGVRVAAPLSPSPSVSPSRSPSASPSVSSPVSSPVGGYPATIPALTDPAGGICTTGDGPGGATVRVGGAGTAPGETTAATVQVRPGAGALVRDMAPVRDVSPGRDMATGGGRSGGVSFVSDQGIRYPVGGADDLAALGYRGAPVVTVPAGVLGLLQVGPVLDRAAASREAGRA